MWGMQYDSLRPGRPGGSNTGVGEIFRTRPPALENIPPLVKWAPVLFPEVRRLRRCVDHPPPSSPEVKDTASSLGLCDLF